MFYKVIFLAAILMTTSPVQASPSFDVSGLHELDAETLPEDGRFHAIAGFEASSFFYTSDSRGVSSTTFQATAQDEFTSSTLHGKADLQFYSFVDSNPSIGVESRELYLQTKPALIGNSQVTVGRKVVDWSKLDQAWFMMSVWSPRWTWDELHPEIIGMTGIFYTYTTPRFEFVAFGSPISIPERGTNTVQQNNNLVSSDPLWKNLPNTVNVLGTPTQVNYSLITPSLSTILFRPNFALRAKYTFDSGFWASLNSGVLPINVVQLSAEPFLDTNTGQIQVNIRPEFPMRNINTAEVGVQKSEWDLWLSVSYEQPFNFTNQPTWLNPVITSSSIVSAGTEIKLTSNFTFSGAALFIHEQPFTSSSSLSGINVQLPSRFPLKQGFKVAGNWKFDEYTESTLCWIQDLLYQTHYVSVDVAHRFRTTQISAGVGADLLLADTTQGWVGQYYGDDRVQGWLKYAF